MTSKPIKVPGPDHPITLHRFHKRVTATVGGRTIADSSATITLHEGDYPAVEYFPRTDVDMSALERTDHTTYCPFKGDANYFSIRDVGGRLDNVVWTYESPYDAVAEIKEYVAFYPDQVDVRAASDERPAG